jgi:hypothetical protein
MGSQERYDRPGKSSLGLEATVACRRVASLPFPRCGGELLVGQPYRVTKLLPPPFLP